MLIDSLDKQSFEERNINYATMEGIGELLSIYNREFIVSMKSYEYLNIISYQLTLKQS